jgi:ComF family protein
MKLHLAKTVAKILDVIYPQDCPICGRQAEISTLCENCAKTYINGYRSFVSEVKYDDTTIQVFAVDIFDNKVKEILHNFKYNSIKNSAKDVFRYGITKFYDDLSKADLITFVPLHPLRFLRRGYNQAAFLGRVASIELQIPCVKTMFRIKYNLTQTKKNVKKRKLAVKGLFTINNKVNVAGKVIIIVDDVCTSGATIGECAKILYEAGAKSVLALVLAKA